MRIAYEEDTVAAASSSSSSSSSNDDKERAERKAAFLQNIAKKRQAAAGQGKVKTFTGVVKAQMPKELVEGTGAFEGIDEFIAQLPANYSFEVKKSVWRALELKAKTVALQMPEGLLMYACLIADIIEKFAHAQTIILGDVTYGACCVDDFTARALGADLLVHYGHSCLVSVAETSIHLQYVFVDIRFDVSHLVELIKFNFKREQRLAIVGTIQFASSFHEAKRLLEPDFDHLYIPQAKPLSGGELLGCTSPTLPNETDAIIYVADGRFHLESIMIANPNIPAYKYDPHSKKFSVEQYDHKKMLETRKRQIDEARSATHIGVILGTLGRQGNLGILDRLLAVLKKPGREVIVVLMSELSLPKLDSMPDIQCWIQIACPRLSVDWGYSFNKPLLNSYEAFVCFGDEPWRDVYPQDYYSSQGGKWANYYSEPSSVPVAVANADSSDAKQSK